MTSNCTFLVNFNADCLPSKLSPFSSSKKGAPIKFGPFSAHFVRFFRPKNGPICKLRIHSDDLLEIQKIAEQICRLSLRDSLCLKIRQIFPFVSVRQK